MSHPAYTQEEAEARETFLAMMWSFSYPGRVHTLPLADDAAVQAAMSMIGATLLDLETSYFTPDESLAGQLAATHARDLSPERAAYHFYPQVDTAHLTSIERASVGTMLYPDQAATLVTGCALNAGLQLTLTGPGIDGSQMLRVGNLPGEFWELRQRMAHYPLGWDVILVAGNQIIGIPRSAQIVIEG